MRTVLEAGPIGDRERAQAEMTLCASVIRANDRRRVLSLFASVIRANDRRRVLTLVPVSQLWRVLEL